MSNKFAIAYGMKKKQKCAEGGPVLDPVKTRDFVKGMTGKAHGGFAEEENASGYEMHPEAHEVHNEAAAEEDMKEGIVDRIMKRFSKGGQVANDTHPFEDDFAPNEFDDLVLDDELSPHFSGPGNEEGDPEQDKRDNDLVSRIMASRKKKDHNPRPA